MRHRFKPLAPTALAALLLATGSAFAQQPPPPPPADAVPPPPPMAAAAATADARPVAAGQVQRLLVNPSGDVDGLLLSDGTQVAFPPQPAAGLALKAGDRVQVTGWSNPESKVVSATAIGTAAGNRSLVGGPPPRPADPASMQPLTALNTSGKVARVLYTDRGDANGVLLDNGVVVRFPPHVGIALRDSLQAGRSLSARGWGSRTALGTTIEANALGASQDSLQDVLAGPGTARGGPQRPPRGVMPPPPPAS